MAFDLFLSLSHNTLSRSLPLIGRNTSVSSKDQLLLGLELIETSLVFVCDFSVPLPFVCVCPIAEEDSLLGMSKIEACLSCVCVSLLEPCRGMAHLLLVSPNVLLFCTWQTFTTHPGEGGVKRGEGRQKGMCVSDDLVNLGSLLF